MHAGFVYFLSVAWDASIREDGGERIEFILHKQDLQDP